MADAVLAERFGLPPGVELLWESWNGESAFAVFHRQSGQTHLLDELSGWIVKLLEHGPLSRPAMVARVTQEFGSDLSAADIEQFLGRLLPRLSEIGIVEESSPCS